MGLDTSHNAWHGAYSSFSHWRDALCNAAGWTLEPTKYEDGFKASWPKEIDAESLTEENFQGKWDQWPDDPLIILIAHSDCDGIIPAEHCAHLAARLEGLIPKLEEMGDGGGHIGLYAEKTKSFIAGLRLAAEAGEDVDFH